MDELNKKTSKEYLDCPPVESVAANLGCTPVNSLLQPPPLFGTTLDSFNVAS